MGGENGEIGKTIICRGMIRGGGIVVILKALRMILGRWVVVGGSFLAAPEVVQIVGGAPRNTQNTQNSQQIGLPIKSHRVQVETSERKIDLQGAIYERGDWLIARNGRAKPHIVPIFSQYAACENRGGATERLFRILYTHAESENNRRRNCEFVGEFRNDRFR